MQGLVVNLIIGSRNDDNNDNNNSNDHKEGERKAEQCVTRGKEEKGEEEGIVRADEIKVVIKEEELNVSLE